MQNQNQQRPGDGITMRGTFHLIYFLARALSTCVTVFTRHTFGEEALGFNGLAACVLILLSATFAGSGAMLNFFWLWLAALIIQRAWTAMAIRRGAKLHSQFAGYPWLGYLPRFVRSYGKAVVIEYLAWLAFGILMCPVSETLGTFFVVCSWAVLIVEGIERHAMTMEARRMRDAELEMRMRADVHQGKYRDF